MTDFQSYGAEHGLWLIAGGLAMVVWIRAGRSLSGNPDAERKQRWLGLIMSLIPVVLWTTESIRMAVQDTDVDMDLLLPFHLCYFLNFVMPFMLWRKSFYLFEITYFIVMAGTVQALLTPDLRQSFPDPVNIRYFFVHFGLIMSSLYAIFIYGFRPTWRSLWRSVLWVNIYMVFVTPINLYFNTNYMYIRAKPPVASMLDYLGDWPWYLVTGQLMVVSLFTLVLTPFLIFRPRPQVA